MPHLSLELDGQTVLCSNCGQDFVLLYGIQQHIDAATDRLISIARVLSVHKRYTLK